MKVSRILLRVVLGSGVLCLLVGCSHKLQVSTPEPIVIDVRARIDIYQHASSIEDMVSGEKPIETVGHKKNGANILDLIIGTAYAEEIDIKYMTKEVEEAVRSRKERYPELQELKKDRSAGEDRNGLVQLRESQKIKEDNEYRKKAEELIRLENRDREVIYKAIAEQNGIDIEKVKETFTKVHQDKAKTGEWIEARQEDSGEWKWVQKR